MSLDIAEIFHSLQGESTYAGLPCTFVRVAGCNLRCAYCDTPAALAGGTPLAIPEILARVADFGCTLVEITGGEPLCQPEVPALSRRLLRRGYRVLLETNGPYPIAPVDRRVVRIVDVKTPSSGMAGRFCLENLALLGPRDQVKFVVADPADFDWAVQFMAEHSCSPRTESLFSPVSPRLPPRDLARWILDRQLRVRLQIQLHKYLDLP